MDSEKVLKRPIFLRLFGVCATKEPKDKGAWSVVEKALSVNLSKLPELTNPESGVRLEDKDADIRVFLVKGPDGEYFAFRNECLHGKRRLDPVPGAGTLQCCSMGHTTYDYEGNPLTNDLEGTLQMYTVERDGDTLTVQLA